MKPAHLNGMWPRLFGRPLSCTYCKLGLCFRGRHELGGRDGGGEGETSDERSTPKKNETDAW